METNNINLTNKVEKIDVNAKTMDLFGCLAACKSPLTCWEITKERLLPNGWNLGFWISIPQSLQRFTQNLPYKGGITSNMRICIM